MSNDDNKPLTGLTDKLQDLKDEFGNRIENSDFETWLKGVKEEVGDGIEMMARRARGVFNPNLVKKTTNSLKQINQTFIVVFLRLGINKSLVISESEFIRYYAKIAKM